MTTPRSNVTMMGMRARLLALALVGAAALTILPQGCTDANSVVGGACATGYVECAGRCVDLSSDPDHCGACDSARCASGVACNGGVCGGDLDGSRRDGSGNDGGDGAADLDGSLDADDAEAGDSGCNPPFNKPVNCGACGVTCTGPTPTCLENGGGTYICAPPCEAPLVECNNKCVDLVESGSACGVCGIVCPSNVCVNGLCQGNAPGTIVILGHDFRDAFIGSAQARVLTNAVFLPASNPLRILTYEEHADAYTAKRVKIILGGTAPARALDITVAPNAAALASPVLAAKYDVVLIMDQSAAGAATLGPIGSSWALPLNNYLHRGGVVVALDGAGGLGAMPTLITNAGLLNMTGHTPITAADLISVVVPGNAIVTNVTSPYGAFDRSAEIQTIQPNGGDITYVARHVVNGVPAAPVVIHRVIP